MRQLMSIPGKAPNGQEIYSCSNWRVRSKKAEQVHELVEWMVKVQHIKPVEGKVDIHIIAFKKDHQMDSDNIWSKGIIDGLRSAGVLQDDSPKYVGIVSCESRKGDKDETLVMLCDHVELDT